jgi:tetratricopeptide (TPR) repeat protein
VLSFASVLGRSFRRTVLAELLERERLILDPATMDQLDRFIEADGPDRYRFRNGLVCDVVYDGLAYRSRTRLHRRAGEALEQISGDLVADADMLSMHFCRAGDHERTYMYAVMAAERAERAHVNAAAAIHYERAVESSRRLPHVSELERRRLLLALGDVRDRAGLLDDALEAYRRAAMLVGDDDLARADLHLRRARVRQRAGAFRLALREATRAQRVASRAASDDAEPLRARALAFGALVRQRQERAAEALRAAHAAAAEAISCDDRLALARAYNVISWAGLVLGRDDTSDHARRALELYEEVGDLAGQADMANNLGVQAYFEGRWSETLDLYGQSVDACRREGNLVDAATTEANIGEVLVNQGRLDEAEPVLRDAARVLRSSGYVSGAAFAEMHLGRLLAFRGDLGAAQRMLRSRMDELTSMGRTASAYETSLHLADCLTRSGDPQQALALIARTAAQTSEDVSIFDSLRAAASARALIELGLVDEAIMTIAVGVEHARARGLEFDLARLLLLAGRLGPPFDPRLGTTEPSEEAHYLLDRLGVITTVSS